MAAVLVLGSAAEAVVAAPARLVDIAAAVVEDLGVDMKADIVAAARLAEHTVAETHQYGAPEVFEVPCTALSVQNSRRLLDLTTLVLAAEHIAVFVMTAELVSIVDEAAVHMKLVDGHKGLMEQAESCNSFLVHSEHN